VDSSLPWVPILAFLGALAGGVLTKTIELSSAKRTRRLEMLRLLHLKLLENREKLNALHVLLLTTTLSRSPEQIEEILEAVNSFAVEYQTAYSLMRLNLPGPWGGFVDRPADFAHFRLAALKVEPFRDDEFYIFQIGLSNIILAVEFEIENVSKISLGLGELFEPKKKKRPTNPTKK
jgi:hypothetical protein